MRRPGGRGVGAVGLLWLGLLLGAGMVAAGGQAQEAGEWLVARAVKRVAYDYPPGPSLRMKPEHPGTIAREHHVTHDVFFPRGIAVIEYLANLADIGRQRVLFLALPLKVDGGDGSPVRAVALEL